MRLEVGFPAKAEDISRTEQKFGVELPSTMRAMLTGLSAELLFEWSLDGSPLESPQEVELDGLSPDEFYAFQGRLAWSLGELDALDESFFEIEGHPVLPCFSDGYGNYLSFLPMRPEAKVVWWCHEDDPFHGRTVSGTVDRLLECWGEHCWLTPTSASLRRMLGPDSELARETDLSRRLNSVLSGR